MGLNSTQNRIFGSALAYPSHRLVLWEEMMKAAYRMALTAGVVFLSVGTTVGLTPAFAAGGGGGGGGGGGASPTCPKGQVYSSQKKRCVKQKSQVVPDD